MHSCKLKLGIWTSTAIAGMLHMLFFQLNAQPSGRQQLFWENASIELTSKDGLSDLYIKKYVQDSDGFIWIAGHSGLNRFDGSEVTGITIDTTSNLTAVMDMVEDPGRNALWIITLSALYQLDLDSYKSTMIFPTPENEKEWGPGANFSLDLGKTGELLVGRSEGFTIISPDLETIFSSNYQDGLGSNKVYREVHRILPDPERKGIYWLGTDAGLYKYAYAKDQWTHMDKGLASKRDIDVVHFLETIPGTGQLVVSNDGHEPTELKAHYAIFNRNEERFDQFFTLGKGWATTGIFKPDSQHLYLSTTQTTGVYCISRQVLDTIYSNFTPSDPARIDFLDKKQQIWSTLPGKIHSYRSVTPAIRHYKYKPVQGTAYHVCTDIFVDGDHVYMSVFGGDGIYRFNVQKESWDILAPGIKSGDGVYKFTGIEWFPDGSLVALATDGNYGIRGRQLEKLSGPVGDIYMGEAVTDRNGVLWGHHKGSLTAVEISTGKVTSFAEETADCTIKRRAFEAKMDDLGNIWIMGLCTGFICYDNEKNHFIHSRKMDFDERMDTYVASILSYGNLVYIITDNGLVGIVNSKHVEKGYQKIVNLSGVLGMEVTISTAAIARDGCIWVLADKGLMKINPLNWSVRMYDEGDGILLKDEELGVYTAEQIRIIDSTRLVYSTRKSLHIVDMDQLRSATIPPKSYLNTLLVNNEPYRTDSIAAKKRSYQLKPKEDYLTFEFSAIEYDRPSLTRFAYQLKDIDNNWIYSTRKNVTYAHLDGGHYTFLLKADRNDGNWSSPLSVQIHIRKVWYETMFARITGIILLLLAIYLAYRYRMHRVIKEQKLKTKYERQLAEVRMNALTAQMNPHFIFNSLNSIDYYIIKNDTIRASDYLNRFARLIRLILNHSRSNYISLGEELEALKLYLEIESIRFSHKFEYVVEADPNVDLENTRIPPMLFQPFVENAIWHGLMHKSDKGRLSIKMKLNPERNTLIGIIEDNGIGRSRAEELKSKSARLKTKQSMGMSITRNKLEMINLLHNLDAHSQVEDLYDGKGQPSGTRITLTVPI